MNTSGFGSHLHRAAHLLTGRLEALETRIRGGDESVWPEYRETARTLVEIQARTAPELLTAEELADRLGVSRKTLGRRIREGKIRPALTGGEKGQGRRFDPRTSLTQAESR